MSALHHERPRRHQVRKIRVVDHVGKIEFQHVVLWRQHVAVGRIDASGFPDPRVEIRGADGQGVTVQQGRNANRRLTSIREPIKTDALRVGKGKRSQPRERPLMLTKHK